MTPRQGIRCSCGRLLATRSDYSFTAVEVKRRGELVAVVTVGTLVCPSCRQVTRIGDGTQPYGTRRSDVFEVAVGAGSPVEVDIDEPVQDPEDPTTT